MNKELTPLEALENIKHYDTRVGLHEDDYKIIEKELKALEIIKEKKIDVFQLIISLKLHDLNEYNKRHAEYLHLTQEEYDLLKEVLL